MLYFAYGSNMDPRQMARRCPGARSLGAARLAGHRLPFTWDSVRWGGGVGHCEPAAGDECWGVLWELTDEHVTSLDAYEQVADGVYRQAMVVVEHQGRIVEALIYLSNDDRWKRPSRRYVRALVRGARVHGIPAPYVRGIRRARRAGPAG